MHNMIVSIGMSLQGKIVAMLIVALWGLFVGIALNNKPEPPILFMKPAKVEPVQSMELDNSDQIPLIASETSAYIANKFTDMGYILSNTFIPRINITRLPKDLKSLAIPDKKELFVKIMLPLILRENENILHERSLAMHNMQRNSNQALLIMEYLYTRYRLEIIDDEELLSRIMPIPVSLALAQTAIESGWGTSYYAKEGNALFGQHAYEGQKALKSRDGKTGSAKFGVAAFDSLAISVRRYMNNLNTHLAYKGFRKQRVKASLSLGIILSNQLISYSERGKAYIKDIKKMIKHNKFARFENSMLEDIIINKR